MTPQMRQSISACLETHAQCLELVPHCLNLGGRHAEPEHITMMLDSGQAALAAADLILRNSHHHKQACRLAADAVRFVSPQFGNLQPWTFARFYNREELSAIADLERSNCGESCRILEPGFPALSDKRL